MKYKVPNLVIRERSREKQSRVKVGLLLRTQSMCAGMVEPDLV